MRHENKEKQKHQKQIYPEHLEVTPLKYLQI